jgi:hypothetical protein
MVPEWAATAPPDRGADTEPKPTGPYGARMLDRIRNSPRAAELLADVFDFDITRLDPVDPVRLASGTGLRPIAGDASGGTFYDCGGPVLYASSEGSAGLLAADLPSAVELITGIPVWQDVVTYSPDLDAMRAAFESAFAEYRAEFEPDVDAHRAAVAEELGITEVPADELLARLRTCLTDRAPEFVLLNEEGDEFDPL